MSLLRLDTCTLCLRPVRDFGIAPLGLGDTGVARPGKNKINFSYNGILKLLNTMTHDLGCNITYSNTFIIYIYEKARGTKEY